MAEVPSASMEVFKALGDPVRWSIVRGLAAVDELDSAALEEMLTVSRPTIWYHVRILVQAGLVEVGRHGRSHSYSLCRPVLRWLLDEVYGLSRLPAMETPDAGTGRDEGGKQASRDPNRARLVALPPADEPDESDSVVLTW